MQSIYVCLIEGRKNLLVSLDSKGNEVVHEDVLLFSNNEKPIISNTSEELENIIINKYFKDFRDWTDTDYLGRCMPFIQRTPRIAKIERTTAPPVTILNNKIIGNQKYKVIHFNKLIDFTAIKCSGSEAQNYLHKAKIISLTSIKNYAR